MSTKANKRIKRIIQAALASAMAMAFAINAVALPAGHWAARIPLLRNSIGVAEGFVPFFEFGEGDGDAGGTRHRVTARERDMLERIVWAEARGEDDRGQILVVNVIFNRIADHRFPNCVESVIFARGQFTPVTNGQFARATPNDRIRANVQRALNGEDTSRGATFFRMIRGAQGSWHQRSLHHLFDHGTHRFYRHR
ncbi:MAG: cell wall hydrolase [Oscillospiraceae bacterium]|nr:cell wall hydrolase [Oscillospiraceae bacterium]